jgi:ParB family transcriptional regulator, chromosome partitioning protein
MNETITKIPLDRLVPHPDSPNHMSKPTFARLVRNIERTGLYEPLIVRPAPNQGGFYQIINGHHRYQALRQLDHETANVVVWEIGDEQTDIFLATLNRLEGRDKLDKKLTLLRRLVGATPCGCHELAKRLPYTTIQLQRLTATTPMKPPKKKNSPNLFAIPMVFYVSAEQQRLIEDALADVEVIDPKGRSAKRAQALTHIAATFAEGREVKEDE